MAYRRRVRSYLWASVLLTAAGCAGRDELPRGPVRISTFALERDGGAAVPGATCETWGSPVGVPIIIHAPDGSNTVTATDDTGELTVEVAEGSAVTASYAADECGGQHFNTFLAVEAGDHLRFGSPQTLTELGSMTITWPPVTGVEHYEVAYACGNLEVGTTTSTTVRFYAECGTPIARGMVVAYGADTDTPIAWASLGDVTFTDGGTVTIGEFVPPTTQSLEVTGIPASVSWAWINVSPDFGERGIVRPFVSTGGAAPVDGRLVASGAWAPGSDVVFVEGGFEGTSYGTQSWHEQVAAAVPMSLASPPLLPWIDGTSFTVDVPGREVRWTQTGEGSYDGAAVRIVWDRPTTHELFQWAFATPASAPSFTLPTLPPELADLGPTETDAVSGGVTLVERSDVERLQDIPLWEALAAEILYGDAESLRVVVSAP